ETASVELAGSRLEAAVRLASIDSRFAVVKLPGGTYPAAPVRARTASLAGTWLIGIVKTARGKATPTAVVPRPARAPFLSVGLPLAPGSPLFDADGRLVALAVERRGGGCLALPLDFVKARLAEGSP